MNPADEMVPKRETTERQLDGAAAGSLDGPREQLRAVVERPNHQSKPVEDLHGSDGKLDQPSRTLQRICIVLVITNNSKTCFV